MKITNTLEVGSKPNVFMLLYGEGGVGKTTFAASAPKPIMADCEGGTKFLGMRGISMDVAQITGWSDMKEFFEVSKRGEYETIIIDPIGELMEKLLVFMREKADKKLVQSDGSPSLAGWGWLKETMRSYIKMLRDSGKHVILVAHVEEKEDENRIVKRPMIKTKISQEIINMVDIVAYMTVVNGEEESKRVLIIDQDNDKFVAKDRTGKLGKVMKPDFNELLDAIAVNEPQEDVKESTKKAVKVFRSAPKGLQGNAKADR